MKKYIVILLAAVVAFAACTKVNPEEKKAEKISFSVANYVPATKAYASILDEVGTDGFMCKAYLHAAGVTEVQEYFGEDGENITFKSGEWTPSRDYYWPKSPNSYINFVSWYNKNILLPDATASEFISEETSLQWRHCVVSPDQNPNANIMWADKAWFYGKNYTSSENNTMNSLTGAFGKDGVTEGVPTLFHHALAKLTIKAKAAKTEKGETGKVTSWEITIKNAKITNYQKMGDLELFAARTPSTQTPQIGQYVGNPISNGVWVPSGGAAYVGDIELDDTDVLTTTAVDVLAESSILPQGLTAGTNQLTFDVDLVIKYNGTEYSHEVIPYAVDLKTTAISKWLMNTKYIYTITVDPETETIKFDPAAIDWEDTVEANINVPII
jgi:hypothetical protein